MALDDRDIDRIIDSLDGFRENIDMTSEAAKDAWKSLNIEDSLRRNANKTLRDSHDAERQLLRDKKDATQGWKDLARGTASYFTSLASTTSAVYSSEKAFTSVVPVIDQMASVTKTVINAMAKIAGGVTVFGNSISGVTQGMAELAGAGIDLVTAAITQQLQNTQRLVDNFGELSKVGVTFGGDMQAMTRAAAAAGISVDTLTKFVTKNVESLNLLDGSITSGASKIIKMGQSLAATEPQLLGLYGNFDNLNSTIAEYAAQQARYGISGTRLNKDLETSARSYLYQQKELAELTGKSVDQLKKEAEERAKDAAYQVALNKMTADERLNSEAAMAQISAKYGAEAAQYAKEYISTNGKVMSQTGLMFEGMARPVAGTIQQIVGDLRGSGDQYKQRMGDIITANAEGVKQFALNNEMMYKLNQAGVPNDVIKMLSNLGSTLLATTGAQEGAAQATGNVIKSREEADLAAIKATAGVIVKLEEFKVGMDKLTMANFEKTAEYVDVALGMAQKMADQLTYVNQVLPLFAGAIESATGALGEIANLLGDGTTTGPGVGAGEGEVETSTGAVTYTSTASQKRSESAVAKLLSDKKLYESEEFRAWQKAKGAGLLTGGMYGKFGVEEYRKENKLPPNPTKAEEEPKEKMALGGIADKPVIAGEAGPEAIVPLPNGRSIPVDMDLRPLVEALRELLDVNKDNRDYLERIFHASM